MTTIPGFRLLMATLFGLTAVASSLSAQSVDESTAVAVGTGVAPRCIVCNSADMPVPELRKNKANGNYYTRHFGTYYRNTSYDGNLSTNTTIVSAPFTPLTFTNRNAAGVAAQWQCYDRGASAWNDATPDADGNYTMTPSKGFFTTNNQVPALLLNGERFHFGQFSGLDASGQPLWSANAANANIVTADNLGVGLMSLTDNVLVYGAFVNSQGKRGAFYGSSEPGYGMSVCKAVWQYYPQPIRPMALKSIRWMGNSFNLDGPGSGGDTIPIKDGYALHAYIIAGNDRAGTDTLAKADITNQQVLSRWWNTGMNTWYFTYEVSLSVRNAQGQWEEKPVVINQPFTLVLEGFDDDNVDVGIDNVHQQSLYYESDRSADLATAQSWGIPPTLITYGGTSIFWVLGNNARIFFDAMFDVVNVVSGDSLYVGSDGGRCWTLSEAQRVEGLRYQSSRAYKTSGVPTPNYSVQGLPEWLRIESNDKSKYFSSSNWVNTLHLVAGPLPEGLSTRHADIRITSELGAESQMVRVVQGDATGITTPEASTGGTTPSPAYNLAGQRVGADYRGIVVQDGKKHIVR
ncbi:MAG: hypothetical protein J6I60_06600 [Bacteroidaceae bacterium]|nr:hypothetical protein [Bacteroidaceae bacterium]